MDSENAVKTPTRHEPRTPDEINTTQRNDATDDIIRSEKDLENERLKEFPRKFKQEIQTTNQKRFAQQRSILKNSQDLTLDDYELVEAKKQLIQRRRRLFSHYRQYEQWRRRQFSYDPSYYRPHGPPSGHGAHGVHGAFHRRRQYKRQYSCAVASREDSHESRESPSLQRQRYQGMTSMASDSVYTESTPNNQSERKSHFHMLQEEHSTSISERCTRNRINSAIFVSSEGKGFDSIEFLRRHGSQSVLCRKAKSAENITDNERKKSISNKQRWRTEESAEAIHEQNNTETMETEFQESSTAMPSETKKTLSVLNSYQQDLPIAEIGYGSGRSATVTTSNIVIGSISIENPPAHLKVDILSSELSNAPQKLSFGNEINAVLSAKRDSTDTMEELILLPTGTMSNALVHQCSSTSTNKSQSPTISPHYSPKSFNMRGVKPKISTLPMVSVSGPSPPDESRPSSGNL